MIGYIYFIINNTTNQRYVGKTIDIKKRKRDHFNKLNSKKHINKKLQLYILLSIIIIIIILSS